MAAVPVLGDIALGGLEQGEEAVLDPVFPKFLGQLDGASRVLEDLRRLDFV